MLAVFLLLLANSVTSRRILARAALLRQNYIYLPPSSFLARRAYLIDALSNGTYLQAKSKEENDEGPKNPFDPANGGMDTMMDGMKKQMVMMIPQTVIMGWINFFFSGFVLSEYLTLLDVGTTRNGSNQLTLFLL